MCFRILFSIVTLSSVAFSQLEAKECVFNATMSVYHTDGTYTSISPQTIGTWQLADTVYLVPGDTIWLYGWAIGACTTGASTSVLKRNHGLREEGPVSRFVAESGYYEYYCTTTDYTDVLRFYVNSAPVVNLGIRCLLGGPYSNSSGLMNDAYRGSLSSFVPNMPDDGYSGNLPNFDTRWYTDSTIFNVSGANALMSIVSIELRNPMDSTEVLYATNALLQRDGDIVGHDGLNNILLPLDSGYYYVVVKHYSHQSAMTALPVLISNTTVNMIDFTDSLLPLYGLEAMMPVDGLRALWPGNVTSPRAISYVGLANDRDALLQVMPPGVPTAVLSTHYGSSADVNMDGVIKYAGAENDRDIILRTIGGSVPTAIRYEQLP